MRSNILTIFFVYLLIAPLQWVFPKITFLGLGRGAWNAQAGILAIVLLFFYTREVFFGKNKLSKNCVLTLVIISSLIVIKAYFIDHAVSSISEATRLLLIAWFIPIIVHIIHRYGNLLVASLAISILLLHSIWGISQFVTQRDLNLYHLGESRLNIDLAGVAKFKSENGKLIRAYGPYPHSNSLGGCLSIGLACFLLIPNLFPKKAFYPIFLSILLGVIVSFSRSAWMATIIILIIFAWRHYFETKFWRMACFTLVVLLVFTPLIVDRLTDPDDQGVTQRLSSTPTALSIIKSHPLWGVGIDGYKQDLKAYLVKKHISFQPWEIVPMHSVPLLFISEWGLYGVCVFLGILFMYIFRIQSFHTQNSSFFKEKDLTSLLTIAPLALFDHYLLTQTAPAIFLIIFVCLVVAEKRLAPEAVLYAWQ